ncbi:uncharacterized protein EDB91DRAFT_1108566 [Suillus paluster]|uniref:uncharacterized protein n=1 Tax=Suillus paluster TaxID=48578 RepID=UPI001B88432E|nr:uncharacterized protein EDB91DRAFT_1108566 [Suillus paluster]KAG1750638.1 hypothetical protein EDB91DRAFT_1108566 [Suillus paluster]
MTTCSDAPLVSTPMRLSTMGSAPPVSGPEIDFQRPRAESFFRFISMPSTPLRRYGVWSSSPGFQQLSCVYSAPYTESWAEQQLSSSPSPLPKIPTLPSCCLSPSTHNAEGTPFDRHFNLSQSWQSSDTDISPIARRMSDDAFPREGGDSSHRFSGGSCVASPWSLMQKLPALYSSGPRTFSPESPAMHASERSWSPVSCLSALTPLSSPEHPFSDNVPGGLSCVSPTRSPIFGRNATTDHSKDNHGLESTFRRSLRTASRVASVRSCKHPLPENHDEKLPSGRTRRAHTYGGPTATGLTSQTQEAQSFAISSQRRLPPEVSRSSDFSLFYRRYPISSFLQLDADEASLFNRFKHPGGIYNPPRDPRDLYTPRFVKGTGRSKIGLCPICIESPSRGGRGQKIWLSTKFSAFKWSLSFPSQPYDYANISLQRNLAISPS